MPPEHALPPPPGRGTGDEISPGRPPLSARASLLVLGASARAWATSVGRTGLVVRAADLFADRDLVAIAAAVAEGGIQGQPDPDPGVIGEIAVVDLADRLLDQRA